MLDQTNTDKFKDLYKQIRSEINLEEFNNFANFSDNQNRFKYVYNNQKITDKVRQLCSKPASMKSLELAQKFKQLGNQEFAKTNDEAALAYYNRALLYAPTELGTFHILH